VRQRLAQIAGGDLRNGAGAPASRRPLIDHGRVEIAGDTIEAESTILEARASRSRPGEGIISVATCARNQHGAEVVAYRRTLLVYRRVASTPYAAAGY